MIRVEPGSPADEHLTWCAHCADALVYRLPVSNMEPHSPRAATLVYCCGPCYYAGPTDAGLTRIAGGAVVVAAARPSGGSLHAPYRPERGPWRLDVVRW